NHSYLKADKLWFMLEGIIINSGDSARLLDENLVSTTFYTMIRCNRSANSVIWQVIE
ncbi:cobalamin ABC transporter ATP-binding protein, partial [Proteus mirabilis]